jgi:hypothetical protein
VSERRGYPYRARRLGRLIVTWCRQGSGAPLIDHAWTVDREGNRYTSRAIHLRPWRKNRHGERLRGPALVIGWRR